MSQSASVLVVEDEASLREFLSILLKRHHYTVTIATSGEEAIKLLDDRSFDLIISDLKMKSASGLDVLRRAKQRDTRTEVILMTAFSSTESAIEAMKIGAYDYLSKPFKVDELLVILERALERQRLVRDNEALRQQLDSRGRLEDMIGRSEVMQEVFELVRKVAPTKANVLITGESGTGKELVARAIHALGERNQAPFVAINCGAIPETLIESELFGYKKGAFTGAAQDKKGLFLVASGGTLFLDEVSELPIQVQVKLLRALQERRIKPVGGVTEQAVDVRIVAASNRNLEEEVKQGNFRSDLYYRLHVIPIRLPALRDRQLDIPLLAEHFLRSYARASGKTIHGISPEAMAALCRHDYPGNVRELENLIERAVALTSGELLDIGVLDVLTAPRLEASPHAGMDLPEDGVDLDAVMAGIERELVTKAMERCNGNRAEAAQLLRINMRSLRYRLSKYGLQ